MALRLIASSCRCGRGWLEYGGSACDYYRCCGPWKNTLGEIVGYGENLRSAPELESPVAPRRKSRPTVKDAPAHLLVIGAPPPGMTTALYERFDSDKVCLYVGISDAPNRRAKIHIRKSTWCQFAESGKEYWFSSRRAAEDMERGMIEARRPIFNRQHAHPDAHEALVLYLVNRGRFDLIKTTATWG